MKTPVCRQRGFTLIEVLVVVSVIALLVAILLPSLQRAREQAKISVCKSSLQQIGLTVSMYQSAEAGFVPVLLNYYSTYSQTYPDGSSLETPARARWGSVAFRRYDRASSRLPQDFDPNKPWSADLHKKYENSILPRHWSCPFVREKGEGWKNVGSQLVRGSGSPQFYSLWEWEGKHESYHPWLWEEIVRNKSVRDGQEMHPSDPLQGRPKYSALTFNRVKLGQGATEPDIPGAVAVTDARVLYANRRWSVADARRRNSPSLSDVTMLYCAQGSFLAFDHHINNPESHRTGSGAGTNTVFADGHVEWVQGTRIGWP